MKPTKTLASAAAVLSMLWLSVSAAVAANQRRLVFSPGNRREVLRPRSSAHRTRAIVLRAEDGTKLSGWLMKPAMLGRHPAVIYFGGRSEEVSWIVRDAGRLFPGMTVLAVNYRGYGDSLGEPAEQLMVADGRMLFDWLAAANNVDPRRIAVVGRSLGSGVAVQVASGRDPHAVVLITPYDSVAALAKRKFRSSLPIDFVLQHRFDSVKYAAELSAPTYVLRAAIDDIVPHAHTDELVARLRALHLDETIPDSDHLNIPYLPHTQERIAHFLAAQFSRPRA
jgi:dipeptidyl aminopeptidase/acylaminoacyl peptidase